MLTESGEVWRGGNPPKKTLFTTLYPNLVLTTKSTKIRKSTKVNVLPSCPSHIGDLRGEKLQLSTRLGHARGDLAPADSRALEGLQHPVRQVTRHLDKGEALEQL